VRASEAPHTVVAGSSPGARFSRNTMRIVGLRLSRGSSFALLGIGERWRSAGGTPCATGAAVPFVATGSTPLPTTGNLECWKRSGRHWREADRRSSPSRLFAAEILARDAPTADASSESALKPADAGAHLTPARIIPDRPTARAQPRREDFCPAPSVTSQSRDWHVAVNFKRAIGSSSPRYKARPHCRRPPQYQPRRRSVSLSDAR
jgi:hypothetical protein